MTMTYYRCMGFERKLCCSRDDTRKVWVTNMETKAGSTLVTLPGNVTPYRHSVDGTRDHVTYQKLVTRSRYGLVRRAVGILPSHQRDGKVTACADVDGQRDT